MHDFVDTLPQAVLDLAEHPGVDDDIDPAPRPVARWCAFLGRPFPAPMWERRRGDVEPLP
jgi:hypothetical protein